MCQTAFYETNETFEIERMADDLYYYEDEIGTCQFDWLKINTTKYCHVTGTGGTKPRTVGYVEENITMEFKADESTQHEGFQLCFSNGSDFNYTQSPTLAPTETIDPYDSDEDEYPIYNETDNIPSVTDCNGSSFFKVLDNSGGCTYNNNCFSSPNFPGDYDNTNSNGEYPSERCQIQMCVDAFYETNETFEIEYHNDEYYSDDDDYDGTCQFDWLKINTTKYCHVNERGGTKPRTVGYVEQNITMEFHADIEQKHAGFQLCFSNGSAFNYTQSPTMAPTYSSSGEERELNEPSYGSAYSSSGEDGELNEPSYGSAYSSSGEDGEFYEPGYESTYSSSGEYGESNEPSYEWIQLGKAIESVYGEVWMKSMSMFADDVHENIVLAIGSGRYNNSDIGKVQVFSYNGTDWEQLGNDIDGNSEQYFGTSVSVTVRMSSIPIVAIGAPQQDGNKNGYVEIREYNSSTDNWRFAGNLSGYLPNDYFGYGTDFGDTYSIAVGAPGYAIYDANYNLMKTPGYVGVYEHTLEQHNGHKKGRISL